ncbi:MAG: hypothetical protein Q9195_007026 [Heterodermia aff. obscurata]
MAGPSPPYQVKAQYDYSSPHDDDLSFPNGQVIMVTDEEDADWYYGEYLDEAGTKQEGLFPRNFVKLYEPETPPRPSRSSRQRKDLEPVPTAAQEDVREPGEPLASPSASVPESTASNAAWQVEGSADNPPSHGQSAKSPSMPSSAAQASTTMKTVPTPATKPVREQSVDKSISGSFRDRINAFNKPAAPPVAPKPGAAGSASGSGFVRKPFVAPPPSKNAYVPSPKEVPPQKIYRREEDPEVNAQVISAESVERPAISETNAHADGEDQPKPTSLKDRIALLQKQQMEQAARHSEAAQKKDKPKRPPKKRMESQERPLQVEEDDPSLERVTSAGAAGSPLTERPIGNIVPEPPSNPRQQMLREPGPAQSPTMMSLKGFQSDANDADQSGAGDTEEGEDLSTSRDDSDEKPRTTAPAETSRAPQAPPKEPDVGDEEDEADDVEGEEEEEEEDVDPEVKRRMEIRERMAKMSGGMGMAGMFGPPGGMPGIAPKKQSSGSNERKAAAPIASDVQASRAPPVPIVPIPGMHKVISPEQSSSPVEISKEEPEGPNSTVQDRDPEGLQDVEDIEEETPMQTRRSLDKSASVRQPQDRPVPPLPGLSREAPPPRPIERSAPPVPAESRPLPRPPPTQPALQSAGSDSENDTPAVNRSLLQTTSEKDDALPSSPESPPAFTRAGPAPSLPSKPRQPQATATDNASDRSNIGSTETSPTSPTTPVTSAQRASRVPPIPGPGGAVTAQIRAPPPPPPPPSNIAPSRTSTGVMPPVPQSRPLEESDEEVTEYEGDYDTDIAADATHKDALKTRAKAPSLEEDSANDESTLHHSGLPSLGPAPRAVPPPPPTQPPKPQRQSSDMPRAPPPPPPPREQLIKDEAEEYDPYNYTAPRHRTSTGISERAENPSTPNAEDPDDDLYSASPPRSSRPPPPAQSNLPYVSPSSQLPQPPSGKPPRQSLDVQRSSTNARRSMDAPRPSGEHGCIASDLDLGQASQWWRQPNIPPPVLQSRRDIIYEIEESSTTRRGGRQAVTRVVYVLYMDYSQTVITALFESRDPGEVALEQHHEPPPPRMRQDQLEDAHGRFGARIADEANSKKDSVVRDGQSQSLILDLLASHPDALMPVGTRAYGALVYANLANASVQQFDEIRPGDIVTFRNAKFQGHRGPMHSKYSAEVGKPDHVGVVVDWDGTKKKVRAWEQGRESKKVKMESYKLGDMRSGEAKVWRVMSRQWVGWEGQN